MKQINPKLIHGVVATIDRDNIDTDQIIPTEYLKSIKKFGYEDYLFDGWRYLDKGKLGISSKEREKNKKFILNNSPYDNASVLLTRDNFGCGSSREHAVWALRDFGIRAVIASSFGDIFYNNCFKNGVLPIILPKVDVENLFQEFKGSPLDIEIFLEKKLIKSSDREINFEVDNNLLERIIFGLDDVDITLRNKEAISAYEEKRMIEKPWIYKND
ncbi:3-isopropylmalate dehydratase small subunit [Gammaproteobacteria bacterium]|jgi:3-isopropylmalate/(R)-2-methylmalate dehydratase small subunit|nr:3-isopropylmalate dehydratase small subunit [Gammaproteobacteria bacterium]MDA9143540.1 3-isopropylmalate dehydratase small subunit [Gammaproteobacteria bacterium]MDA9997940.1 3-isopropylmalate dehydratase small subunit [Gammaproteobacteria bacterium]